MKNEKEKIDKQEGNGVLPCVTKRYFHELGQKEIDTLKAMTKLDQLKMVCSKSFRVCIVKNVEKHSHYIHILQCNHMVLMKIQNHFTIVVLSAINKLCITALG
jgi:hypothetical protein